MDSDALLAAARGAIEDAAGRLADLVRAADASDAIPDSDWTVGDAAVHVIGGADRYVALARGVPSPVADLLSAELAARARGLIDAHPGPRAGPLDAQLRDAFHRFLAETKSRRGAQVVDFHAGLRPDLARLACISLGELVLHGYDIAAAVGAPWPIDPAHAALVVTGHRALLPAIHDPAVAAGLAATFRLEVAGTDPYVIRVAAGAAEPLGPSETADCVIHAEPVAAALVGAGRMTQWAAVALGQMAFSGTRPELGPSFATMFRFP